MAIVAYSEAYLSDAKDHLADMFDYAVYDCKQRVDRFAAMFVQSGYAQRFERGNPSVVAGMSGIELAIAVLDNAYASFAPPERTYSEGRSPEYWMGWALAEYQWQTGRRFKDIFSIVKASDMIQMYPLYHEMDVGQFIDGIERRISSVRRTSKLQSLRKAQGISQAELSRQSGVNLNTIRAFEQRVNNIGKAQANTVNRLAKALHCSVEDLLEYPQ